MRRLKLDTSAYLLIAMIFIAVFGLVATLFALRSDPVDESLASDRIVSMMFVIDHEGKPLSAHVFSFYPPSRRGVVFDLPCELGLILKALGRVDRIDAVYDRSRPHAFLEEASGVLGLEIPFFIAFDLDALSDFVDLVEGLGLFIADGVDEEVNGQRVLLPPGSVILDGDKVRSYASYVLEIEEEETVFARRQHLVTSIFAKLAEKRDYLNQGGVADFFFSLPESNMNKKTFFRLLDTLASVDMERLSVHRIAGNYRVVSDQRLLFPAYDGSLAKEVVKRSLTSLVHSGEGGDSERVYAVRILNGTTSTGMAKKTADLLQGFGYDTTDVGNADRNDYEETYIIDHTGMRSAALLLGEVIRCDSIQTEELQSAGDFGSDSGVDFTLIIGKDFNGRYVIR